MGAGAELTAGGLAHGDELRAQSVAAAVDVANIAHGRQRLQDPMGGGQRDLHR